MSSAYSGSTPASGELVVAPEKGCRALRSVRSNWRQMLRSTPLARLIVRHSCARHRMSPVVPPLLATSGNHCRSTCAGGARDRLGDRTPGQRARHRQSGLEVRVRIGLPEALDFSVVRRGAQWDGGARRCDMQVQSHRGTGRVGSDEGDVVGVGDQFAVLVAGGTPERGARAAVVGDVEVLVGECHLRANARRHVRRRHVVVGVCPVGAGVEVEQRQRVEVRDHSTEPGPVLVEDRQECEAASALSAELARQKPRIGLVPRMVGLRGGKAHLVVARYQLERVTTPIVGLRLVHGPALFYYVYINSNFWNRGWRRDGRTR